MNNDKQLYLEIKEEYLLGSVKDLCVINILLIHIDFNRISIYRYKGISNNVWWFEGRMIMLDRSEQNVGQSRA